MTQLRNKNNIIIFGLSEEEKSSSELLQKIKDTLKTDLKINLEATDVSKVHRIVSDKGRNPSNEKRKRDQSTSPGTRLSPKNQQTLHYQKKTGKTHSIL
ncbi:unnamed protein product [Leptidea sinapis]|uniref:Uncharacterized protein n=1 Tax=Leptidea sinapis TaxID=189913 RepID=A0A5E4PWH9_9NEOP|nr:unnamed protein product [Leptidea sinapis]